MEIKEIIRDTAKSKNLFVSKTMKVFRGIKGAMLYQAENLEQLKQYVLDYKKPRYGFKTEPFDHQRDIFEDTWDKRNHALFMEMGTGKTKVSLDTVCALHESGKVDCVIVVAPSGVQSNWINECKVHIPDRIAVDAAYWSSKLKKRQKDAFMVVRDGKLIIRSVNIESVATKAVWDFLVSLTERYPCALILDESSRIKNHKAKRTKNLIALGKRCEYRRILTGTPITQSPFDLFTQFQFLDSKIISNQNYFVFKHKYGIFENYALRNELIKFFGDDGFKIYNIKKNTGTVSTNELMCILNDKDRVKWARNIVSRTPIFIQEYKNIDALYNEVEPYCSIVKKEDCLDLPETTHQVEVVPLSSEQDRIYRQLKTELVSELKGDILTVPHALTKLLRLQQVVGGFFNTGETKQVIGETVPRVERVKDIIRDIIGKHKVIIWCRFVDEIKLLMEELKEYNPEGLFGEVHAERRIANIKRFQEDPECRLLIGNQQVGGIGINLTAATYSIYFSNNFSLEDRLQSEARCHRIGQKRNVTYIDMQAEGTIDEHIIKSLSGKADFANRLMNKEFISEVLK